MSRNDKTSHASQPDDEALIKEFLANNARAFDRLVVKHQSMVLNLCFRIIGDYDEANDCAQETFIKVYNNLKKFRFQSSFSTWLYRIAINTCRNRLASSDNRRKKKTVRIDNPSDVDGETLDINDCSFNPVAVFEKNEDSLLIHKAISSLPDELRVLVVLRDLEGKSYEEISDMTGVNLGTVKSRLARARHILRESLREVFA
ncbi:MAG TPA: sigma-70 family RNA polymerase sigma factor [Spirochaetota bacterium]|nr:sigma-70 family RNA polymerase sigma factor [Spirochaetota bacterium]HOD15509.1 sigma-70 family RNA polymerase sigma factor [Spirochaetota bacterium]HPG50259.1 sigma-70 family RNA polymerase sigma factor [Spirochaetota bacterium]HPN11986.1 sigma-70 family RNA polymerase sigma factor [Spirochaetota bacterium]HQL82458.1 sigma-70 family RNA polymerase sigma factor [Spirochaetota bacterium]